jgi:hypothetical protein
MMNYRLLAVTILLVVIATACSGTPPPSIAPTSTLDPSKGRVVGTLQVRSPNGTSEPVREKNIYLGPTVKDATGNEMLVSLDRVGSPRAITDSQGHFVFQNVPTGHYGLIYDLVFDAFLLRKPNTQDAILIDVTAGKETDLGTLLFDALPPYTPEAPPYP